VRAISSGIASLPAYVYCNVANGRELDDNHAVARLIASAPNQHLTWTDWREWTMARVPLRGNGLIMDCLGCAWLQSDCLGHSSGYSGFLVLGRAWCPEGNALLFALYRFHLPSNVQAGFVVSHLARTKANWRTA
jgi:hypothetical protein